MTRDALRVALVFQEVDPSRGGAETYVVDLSRKLIEYGHEVILLANRWQESALPSGVQVIQVDSRGATRRQRIWSFATSALQTLRETPHDCSIGFINTFGQDILIPQGGIHEASLLHNSLRYPAGPRRWLYTALKRANPRYGLYRALQARQFDPAGMTRVVAVSQFVKSHLLRWYNLPPDRITVIPNAIDADRLAVADPAQARRSFREKLGLPADAATALFVAHNFRLKGLNDLIAALALRKKHDATCRPVHAVVCGGGDLGPYRRMVRREGLDSVVHLLGYVDDLKAAFQAADFFVLPSYYDPCSLVVFEALACGLPVITTQQNGAGEVIAEGQEGFVIPSPKDHQALARAIDQLSDTQRRQRMSVQARELGRQQSLDLHVQRLLQVIRQVAALRGRLVHHGPHRMPGVQAADGLSR